MIQGGTGGIEISDSRRLSTGQWRIILNRWSQSQDGLTCWWFKDWWHGDQRSVVSRRNKILLQSPRSMQVELSRGFASEIWLQILEQTWFATALSGCFFWPNLGLDRRACEGTTAMPLATVGEKSGQGARSGALCALSSFPRYLSKVFCSHRIFAAAVEETDSSGCGVKQHDLQMFVGGATVDQV